MPLSSAQIEQRLQEIENLAEPLSQRYGRLLNWQNPSDPFWHYGIGLSDLYIFDTGQGLCPFERRDAKLVLGIDRVMFEPQETFDRLKSALRVFGSWNYNLVGWNCEHLSRLIATDQPKSYQSQPIWWLCNLTPEGEHKTARQIFQDYLMQINAKRNFKF
jgi:hypothetical protein